MKTKRRRSWNSASQDILNGAFRVLQEADRGPVMIRLPEGQAEDHL